MSTTHPPAFPHGTIETLFPDIFFVQGTVKMAKPPVTFSRNMIILRHGESLTLVNTVRLDDAGLAALDALGTVEHVIRIAGFHGMDDPFYQSRYGAKVWAVAGHVYAKGFNAVSAEPRHYFEPDASLTAETPLPFPGARLLTIGGRVPEGVLILDRDGGIVITGDALQNWNRVDRYFSFFSGLMMRFMGFIKAHNVGPGWLKEARPVPADLAALRDAEFEHVIPGHGAPVIGSARAKFLPSLDKALGRT